MKKIFRSSFDHGRIKDIVNLALDFHHDARSESNIFDLTCNLLRFKHEALLVFPPNLEGEVVDALQRDASHNVKEGVKYLRRGGEC